VKLPRPSIRLRLALVYSLVLVATCTALLGLNYALLYKSLYATTNGSPVARTREDDTIDKEAALRAQQARIADLRTKTLVSTVQTSAFGLGIAALAGFGLSWFVAGRMLRPLRTLTATTRRISQDRLGERVALTGPRDELKELADTFDEMVARLETSFAGQRRFVADAAHELRTPLAIVRTGAEVQLAKRESSVEQWEATGRRMLIATGRAERLLDGLLALARSDSGVIAREPHDLAIAAAGALSETDEPAELTVSTDLRSAPVIGDPVLLDRLVRNLVDNAIRHNEPCGWVDVKTRGADGTSVLTVSNSGPVIPAADVDRLFEPFQRLAPERAAGSRSLGLGLAIVRSIVQAHDGSVLAVPNDGGGLTVTVAIPVSSANMRDR
jgi:signal transduction histidine kinase